MGSASKDYTTPSWLFMIAAISFIVDVFFGVAFMADTPRVEAFIDAVYDSYLLQVIITLCCIWWLDQFFVEPYLFLKSFPRYFSQGSKKVNCY